MNEPRAIATPCVKVCVIDPATQLCEGCGRTLNEIARWLSFTAAEREKIMLDLQRRLDAFARGDNLTGGGR